MSETSELRDERAAMVAALRELADLLEQRPELPCPTRMTGQLNVPSVQEVEDAARVIGTTAEHDNIGGHHVAALDIGGAGWRAPVQVQVVHISAARMAEWHAERTYAGCVQPT